MLPPVYVTAEKAARWFYRRHRDRCAGLWVELDDLIGAAFLAVTEWGGEDGAEAFVVARRACSREATGMRFKALPVDVAASSDHVRETDLRTDAEAVAGTDAPLLMLYLAGHSWREVGAIVGRPRRAVGRVGLRILTAVRALCRAA
jgi:hypothetical protein